MRFTGETDWGASWNDNHGTLKGTVGTASVTGDNSGYNGVVSVGANAKLLLGSDLANATLKADGRWFNRYTEEQGTDIANTALGVSSKSSSLVTVKNLEMAAGTTLDVGSMISSNAGYGFKVTGRYTQSGVVTVDVNNVSFSTRRVQILSVPTSAGTLNASNFVVINNPTEGCTFQVETSMSGSQVLTLINPNGTDSVSVTLDTSSGVYCLKTFSTDEIIGAYNFNISAGTALSATTDTTTDDWYRIYATTNSSTISYYVENLCCFDQSGYDVYMNGMNDTGAAFDTSATWSDELAPHAGRYYMLRYRTLGINFTGAKTFAATSLSLGDLTTKDWSTGATAGIPVYRTGADATFNDLRLLENSYISVSAAVTDFTLSGVVRFLSNKIPCYIKANGTGLKFNLAATLLGGQNRILRLRGNYSGCEFNVTGDASGYEGLLRVESGYVVGLGTKGLPNGTLNLYDATAVRSIDTTQQVSIGTLIMASGATIKADKSAYGLAVNTFTPAGKVKLDFGTKPVAHKVTVLTVPANTTLTTDMFELDEAFENYSLSVEETETTKSLVYAVPTGLYYDHPFTSIEAYNTAVTAEATASLYANTDTYVVLDGVEFQKNTDYSFALTLVDKKPDTVTQPKLHAFFYNCKFPENSFGLMSGNGPGQEMKGSDRKMIAIDSVKELVVQGCTFPAFTYDSYVIDLNLYNWYENDGCGITIKDNVFAAGAGNRVPLSVKNKIANPPAFVLITGNTFHGANDVAGTICFGDGPNSTTTYYGANFPITIEDNTFDEGTTYYRVMSGVYNVQGASSKKDTYNIPVDKSFTWSKVGDAWAGNYAFKRNIADGVTADLTSDGTCTINATSEGATLTADMVSSIGKSAVANLTLGANITKVDASAFAKCFNLKSVTSTASSMTLADYAFYRCNSITEMNFAAMPTLGENSITMQAAIYMKDGLPSVYPIPKITVTGYKTQLLGTNELNGDATTWSVVDPTSEESRTTYHFFKLQLVKE